MDFARWLHVLGVVVWVGGMFFAYMALRPAVTLIDPPVRLALWRDTFRNFFLWVWISVAAILLTGLHMLVAMGGMRAPLHATLMTGTGILMTMIFLHIYFAPWRRLRRAVDAADWQAAARALGQIRYLVGTNLVLGLLTVTIATAGRAVL